MVLEAGASESQKTRGKKKGPGDVAPSPSRFTFDAWALLGRAGERVRRAHVLHGILKRRKARVERLSRLLRRVHPKIVDLGGLRDIGVESRLREVALDFPRLMQALGARNGLERRHAVFDLLLREGEHFAVDALESLRHRCGR